MLVRYRILTTHSAKIPLICILFRVLYHTIIKLIRVLKCALSWIKNGCDIEWAIKIDKMEGTIHIHGERERDYVWQWCISMVETLFAH